MNLLKRLGRIIEMGQRVAKDYAAAVTLASYFAVWMITMYLLGVGFEVTLP